MEKSHCCPECGSELPQDAPHGVCPQCLLRVGLLGESTNGEPGHGETLADTANHETGLHPAPVVTKGSSHPRRVGEYELLEEIARGGMGVVYRARQPSLNRIVAVKMIRSGQLASDLDVERFFAEAESAASLDHPGIVPIYEVGQDDQQNYFSMAFVQGPSLATRLQEGPLAPTEAAELTRRISEAVAYAHGRGVIHRDLKPANILLAPSHPESSGEAKAIPSSAPTSLEQPRVTDFGLAKHANRRSDLTETGQVIGTPSYMPPEQALGKTDQINQASDVYSLGAILYATLTGRPPFQAANPVDTLMQVVEQDAVEPRQLNAEVPRDLETICLKCLEKEPERRYSGARALADDLQRFLDGDPIQARPLSLADRGVRWLQKQRGNVTLGFIATTATALFLTLALVSWQSLSQWNQGYLSLSTDGAPMVAEFFDAEEDRVAPPRTIPTAEPIALPADEYLLRVSAKGRLSETFRGQLRRDEYANVDLNLDDQLLWPALAAPLQFATAELEHGADIIQYSDDGITRFDGAERWKLRLRDSEDPKLTDVPGFTWPWPEGFFANAGRGKFDLSPRIISMPDLDGDKHKDLVLVARHQAWLLSVSGATGEVIWMAARGDDCSRPARRGRYQPLQSAVIGRPQLAGDLDGDGLADLIATFCDTKGNPTSGKFWIEAISSASGNVIWTFDIKPNWLSTASGVPVPYHFRHFTGGASGSTGSGSGQSVRGRELTRGGPQRPSTERYGSFVYAPDDLHLFRSGDSLHAALTAGKQVVMIDLASGQPIAPPKNLMHLPLRDAVTGDVDGDGQLELIYVCDHAAGSAAGQVELVVWSLAKQEMLFRKTLQADYWLRPNTYTPRPQWPLTADLDGDGRDEIMVPSGSSGYSGRWPKTGWGNLNVLEGTTGKLRWQRQLRTMDEQVDRFLPGPDINGDGHRELFVATLLYQETELFVDCLSGSDGRSLWMQRHVLGKPYGRRGEFWLGRLQWWNDGQDGWPQLLVPVSGSKTRQLKATSEIFVVSAGTGKLSGVGKDMDTVAAVDVDGDQAQELITLRRDDSVRGSGIIHVIRPSAAGSWRRISREPWQNAGDLDQDGIDDLIQDTGNFGFQAVSGATGQTLWRTQLPAMSSTPDFVSLHRDLNGDGVNDVLTIPAGNSGGREYHPFVAISGRSGQLLWTADIECHLVNQPAWVEARDLDQDGQLEVLLVNKLDLGAQPRSGVSSKDGQLWLFVLSGRSGSIRWQHALSGVDTQGKRDLTTFETYLERDWMRIELEDLNDDRILDFVLVAEDPGQPGAQLRVISGEDGQTMWNHKLPNTPADEPFTECAPLVDDIDGDGEPDVLLLETGANLADSNPQRNTIVRVKSLDRSDGSVLWSWETATDRMNRIGRGPLTNKYRRWCRPRLALIKSKGESHRRISLNLWGSQPRVVLLDHLGRKQAELPIAGGQQPGVRPFDIDGDGSDELITHNESRLSLIDPNNEGRIVWERPMANSLDSGVLQVQAGSSLPLILCKEGNKILGIDASSGDRLWSCDGPSKVDPENRIKFTLLHQNVQGDRLLKGAAIQNGDVTICRLPTAILADGITPAPARLSGIVDDPRLLRDLPWMSDVMSQTGKPIRAAVTLLWYMLLSTLLIVLPGYYLRQLTSKRSWSLALFLMLPAVVGIVIFALAMPAPDLGVRMTPVARTLMAFAMLPAVILPVSLTTWVLQRQWKRLLTSVVITIALSLLIASVILWSDSLSPGPWTSYSWQGWYAIFVYGAYWVGWAMIVLGIRKWFLGVIQTQFGRNQAGDQRMANVTG